MSTKKTARLRRAKKTRFKIKSQGKYRLCVNKTPRHIYAQVISPCGGQVLATSSTLQNGVVEGYTGNIEAAQAVGKDIAEKAKAAGVETVVFDRSGFRIHGRVKALADSAREGGLQF